MKQSAYKTPPEPIHQLADAPRAPQVLISSDGKIMLILEMPGFPSIRDVAAPMLRLAGLRINPANNATANRQSYTNITVRFIDENCEKVLDGLPRNPRINNVAPSPDETKIAFTHSRPDGVELWVADLRTLKAQRVSERLLNDAAADPFMWHPSGDAVIAQFIPQDRGDAPTANHVPSGPVVQENEGHAAQARTYQDLLKNTDDIALFDYYLTAQLVSIDVGKGTFTETKWGKPAIYRDFSFSPDGKYLLVETVQKPYSYTLPISYFPYAVQIWDNQGALKKELYHAPPADDIPIDFDAVRRGPRRHHWRNDQPATLYWVEAQDQGNPAKEVVSRDFIYTLPAPFDAAPQYFAKSTLRFSSLKWGNEKIAILEERWWKTRLQKRTWIHPQNGDAVKVLLERQFEDSYTNPGNYLLTKNQYNRHVLLLDGESTFTIAPGASPEGNQPFLARWNLETNERIILFRSQAPYFEYPVHYEINGRLIISREAPDMVPNYYLLQLPSYDAVPITHFLDPYKAFRGVTKQQLSYTREDGITLTATLYLPKGYKKEDGALPLIIWAYPREFKSTSAASRVKGSPYQFAQLSWKTPVYWATRGYAVMDQTDMPVIGENNAQPNDSFVQQLRQNAQAAIDYVAKMGVVDPQRVAVGGHSYGAFMTANLLAHTDLFAAGIARSGAYNRTLTPFGFQSEERTYWQAPEIY